MESKKVAARNEREVKTNNRVRRLRMDTLLYIGLIPITVGGLVMYLKLNKVLLRILGLVLFAAGLLCYFILPAVLRDPG